MPKSIRRRAFYYFTLAILVITLAFSSLIYFYFDNTLRQRIETDLVYAAGQTARNVDSVLTSIKQTAYYLCCNETIAELLVNADRYASLSQQNLLSRAFGNNTVTFTSPVMQSAYAALLLDSQFPIASEIVGERFSFPKITRQHLYGALDEQYAEWYVKTAERRGQIHTFIDPSNDRYIFFSHQLRNIYIADPRYNEVVGTVIYAVPATRFAALLANVKVTEGTIALFMYNDAILSSTDDKLFPISGALSDAHKPLSDLRGLNQVTEIELDGISYSAGSTVLYKNWKVVLLIPSVEMSVYLRDLLPMLALFIVALLIIGLVLSGLFARRLTRPIRTLSGVMLHAQDAPQLLEPAPMPNSRDEIELLYKSYNSMVERISALTAQAAAEEEEKRAAELRALQAQINPHFIYNTLDSVACIALISGQDDIVTMVTSLIDILKYSIQFSRATVTLREELTYLERYIQIQHLRYSDNFRYTCDVPPIYDDVRVSQIILQPLVENSLLHASPTGGKLEIRLYCERAGDILSLHVTDNGSSADAEELNSLLRSAEAGERYGIGIRNVHKRIQLNMGAEYGLRYEALASGGLDAIITIPMRFE